MILEKEKNGNIHENNSAMINAIPERFKNLGEISFLSAGSTGQVFRIRGEKEYALKIVRCGNSASKYQRALYELHIMDDLKEESRIVQLYDYEIVDAGDSKTIYLLEQFYIPLKEYLSSHLLHAEDIIQLVIGVCDSLLACMRNNVLHLDVQPNNIYVDDSASVKLGDFSHSLKMSDVHSNCVARGTMTFMAPEVFREGKCSELSDLYSVGLLLYTLFNHMELPFMASDQEDVSIYKRLAGTPLPVVPLHNSELQKNLCRIIERACSFYPLDRYSSIAELKSALYEVYDNIKAAPENNVEIYGPPDPQDNHRLPVVYVLQTAGEMKESLYRELNSIVWNSLDVIKTKAGVNTDIRVSMLVGGCRAEWLYYNAPVDALNLEFSAPGNSSFCSALEELNDKLSSHREDSLLYHTFYRPVVIFVSDGTAKDEYETALSQLKRNPSFIHANIICFNLGKESTQGVLHDIARNKGTILSAETIGSFETILRFNSIYEDRYEETCGIDSRETSAAIWDADNSSDLSGVFAAPMSSLPMITNDRANDDHLSLNPPPPFMQSGREKEHLHPYNSTIPPFGFDSIQLSYGATVQQSVKRCRVCDNRIDDNAYFCPYCGSKVVLEKPDVDIRKAEFSVIAPKRLIKGDYSIIKVVMYEKTARDVVDSMLKELEENAQENRSGMYEVKDGAKIKVVITSPDIAIEDNVENGVWQGDHLIFYFSVLLPEQYDKHQLMMMATIYINEMIATKLKFVVKCFSVLEQKIEVSREDVLTAFVSYASQDRNRVATIIQGMKKARPDLDVFFDVDSLRSGEDWEQALHKEIEKRDVLYLCWSHNARESKWVDMEWRYALEKKGLECIEPVAIESPDSCPPPTELKNKYFNDKLLYIINSDKNVITNDELLDGW